MTTVLRGSRIKPKFSSDCWFWRSTIVKYFFAERRWMKIFHPNRYVKASYEWPISEQLMGNCCPIVVSCLNRPSKFMHFLNGDLPSNNTTQNQQKLTEKLTQTSWFQTNFAVNLWLNCNGHGFHHLAHNYPTTRLVQWDGECGLYQGVK